MSRRYQLICALLLISLCAGLRISSAQPKLPTAVIPPAPPGYLLVDEEMWSQLADEAGRHLDRAREGFLHGHTRTTAMELHKAAIMMRIDAMHWEDHADQLLLKSAHELEQLAHQLKSPQSITNIDDVDAVSSRALAALAEHQQIKANLAWKHHHFRRSGHYLRASADNLERAAFRARVAISVAASTAVRDARVLSANLIEGTADTIEGAQFGIETLGRQIKHLSHVIVHPFVEGRSLGEQK